jgi:hypothetical protein
MLVLSFTAGFWREAASSLPAAGSSILRMLAPAHFRVLLILRVSLGFELALMLYRKLLGFLSRY